MMLMIVWDDVACSKTWTKVNTLKTTALEAGFRDKTKHT